MATWTLEQIDAKIAELEAAADEAAILPDAGTVGATSFSGNRGTLQSIERRLATWRRRRRLLANGGVAQPPRRGCC